MKFKLKEKLNTKLEESVKNIFEFTVIEPNDSYYQDTIEAFSWKQAKYLAHKRYPKCLIRDLKQITNNKDPEDSEKQISMFED